MRSFLPQLRQPTVAAAEPSSSSPTSTTPTSPSPPSSRLQRLSTLQELELAAMVRDEGDFFLHVDSGNSSASMSKAPSLRNLDDADLVSTDGSLYSEDLEETDDDNHDEDGKAAHPSGTSLTWLLRHQDSDTSAEEEEEAAPSCDDEDLLVAPPRTGLFSKVRRSVRMQRHRAEKEHHRPRIVLEEPSSPSPSPPASPHRRRPSDLDFEQYSSKRKMTATQEKWNALTMIPSPLYCLYYLLAGSWVDTSLSTAASVTDLDVIADATVCLPPSVWHNLPALPPLPVVAVAAAIVVHAPFSFLYHWTYAVRPDNLQHWSRRLDQSFIHIASALVSYGTSGSWDYFVANALFNADCVYRQFRPTVRPRQNQIRITASILAYTLPILRRGDIHSFVQAWIVLALGGFLFSKYPIGGWSHSAFHMVMCVLPPLIMRVAATVPAAQAQMHLAAQCALASSTTSEGGTLLLR